MRPTPAAEDDQGDVGDRGDRHDVQRDPRAPPRRRRPAERSPGARRGEDRGGVVGRRAASSRRRRRARRAGRRAPTSAAAHGSSPRSSPRDAKSISPAAPWRPRCSSPPSTSPAPSPVPTETNAKSSTPAADAARLLADRGELDVVLDVTGSPRRALELRADGHALEAGHVLGSRRGRSAPRRRPACRPRRRRAVRRQAGAATSAVAHVGDGVEQRAAPAPVSSTSWRARIVAAEVGDAPRRKRAPMSMPEHERGLRDGLEEHGAVAAAGPAPRSASRTSPASSSDCSATETVGFEMPARREISAREIGAPSRIASSTARSLRSLEERRLGGGRALGRGHSEGTLTRSVTDQTKSGLTRHTDRNTVALVKVSNEDRSRRGGTRGRSEAIRLRTRRRPARALLARRRCSPPLRRQRLELVVLVRRRPTRGGPGARRRTAAPATVTLWVGFSAARAEESSRSVVAQFEQANPGRRRSRRRRRHQRRQDRRGDPRRQRPRRRPVLLVRQHRQLLRVAAAGSTSART